MNFDLLLIIDASIPDWLSATRAALHVGGPRIAVCARAAGAAESLAIARALRTPTRESGSLLLVNDRLDVMQLAQADGVHLKESGVEVEDARALGATIVGASCHDALGLERRKHADYRVLSPFGEVPGKNRPLGKEGFRSLRNQTQGRVLALGGIGPANIDLALAAGADGIGVIRAILGAANPSETTRSLLSAVRSRSETSQNCVH